MKLHWPRFRMAGIEGGNANAARSRWAARTQGRLEHAHGAVLDGPGGPGGLACCCDPGRFRSSAAVAVAGAAAAPSSRPRQAPAPSAPPDSRPQRPARHHHQHTGQGPDHRAVQQPGQLGLSQWLPVGAGHERLQRSTQHRAGAALAGQRVDPKLPASHRAPPPRSSPWPRWVRRVPPPRRRNHEATTPKERDSRPGRCSVTSHPPIQPVEGGCRLAGRTDRRGVGSGRVPGHGPGSTRQPL
jgi:hypothetical protein